MLKVFKYPIKMGDYFDVCLPKGAKILKIDCQFNNPQMWALVDPTRPNEKRSFRIAGTGHPIYENSEQLNFIDTFKMNDGALIFHIFEVSGVTIKALPLL